MDVAQLRTDERIIRSDLVWFAAWSSAGMFPNPPVRRRHDLQRLAQMVLTPQRILLIPPPGIPSWYRFTPLLTLFTLAAVRRFAPLTKPDEIQLVDVTSLWKWQPEFSGPPMMQVDEEGWIFQLVENHRPWNKPASTAAMREHFEALEAAWEAARTRAASPDTQP